MSLKVGDTLICTKSYSSLIKVGDVCRIKGFFLGYSVIEVGGSEKYVCKDTGHILSDMKIIGVAKKGVY